MLGRFTSPTNRETESDESQLSSSKLSKSTQNLKALLADVTKPNQEAGAAAARAQLEKAKARPKEEEVKVYCTSVSR